MPRWNRRGTKPKGKGGGSKKGAAPAQQQRRSAMYPDHISPEAAAEGLSTGRYVRGKLRINAKARLQAFIAVQGMERDMFIDGEIDRSRALHGDTVVIQILDEAEWPDRRGVTAEPETAAAIVDTDGGAAAEAATALTHALWRPLVADAEAAAEASLESSPSAAAAASAAPEVDDVLDELFDLDLDGDGSSAASAAECAAAASASAKAASLGKQVRGRVVAVLNRPNRPPCTGLLVCPRGVSPGSALRSGTRYILFKPLDGRFPYMKCSYSSLPASYKADPHAYARTLFAVALAPLPAGWPATEKSPSANVLAEIGAAGQIEAETNALLLAEGIEQGPHTDATMAELDAWRAWSVSDRDLADGKRRDLRTTRVFSIDPTTARDLDDALHVTKLADGTFEIGVHIADVSHFVTPDSALDADASLRATTVYLVNKVVPMLPRMLCNEHCSLNPLVERLAFSCIWRMNSDGEVLPPLDRSGGSTNGGGSGAWFGRTVIRSCAKLDYITAQRMVEGEIPTTKSSAVSEEAWNAERRPDPVSGHSCDEVVADVLALHTIASSRRKRRFSLAGGALKLTRPKLTFKLDETGHPKEMGVYIQKESNQLVEEFMLLANFLVAQQLLLHAKSRAFLRSHPAPLEDGLASFVETCKTHGIAMSATTAGELYRSILKVEEHVAGSAAAMGETPKQQWVIDMLFHLVIKPMQPAQYIVAGSNPSPSAWRHYALNIPYYTHFTSPIRRYADVMVHRLLQVRTPFRSPFFESSRSSLPRSWRSVVAREYMQTDVSLPPPPALSLSLTHTHTHTHRRRSRTRHPPRRGRRVTEQQRLRWRRRQRRSTKQ